MGSGPGGEDEVIVRISDQGPGIPPPELDTYLPDPDRYDGRMPQRRCGMSGISLPAVSLGFWHNFGDDTPLSRQRAIMRTAFDAGITHFDLANNYGPPYGAAETNFGRILRTDLGQYRDELVAAGLQIPE